MTNDRSQQLLYILSLTLEDRGYFWGGCKEKGCSGEEMPTRVSIELEIFYSEDHYTGVWFRIFLYIQNVHLHFAFSSLSVCNSQ